MSWYEYSYLFLTLCNEYVLSSSRMSNWLGRSRAFVAFGSSRDLGERRHGPREKHAHVTGCRQIPFSNFEHLFFARFCVLCSVRIDFLLPFQSVLFWFLCVEGSFQKWPEERVRSMFIFVFYYYMFFINYLFN